MEVDWDCGRWRGSAVSSNWMKGLETKEVGRVKLEKSRGQVLEKFAAETHQ